MTQLDKIEVLLEMISEDIGALKKGKSECKDQVLIEHLSRLIAKMDDTSGDLEFQESVFNEFKRTQKLFADFQPSDQKIAAKDSGSSVLSILSSMFWPFRNLAVMLCLSIVIFLSGSLCMYFVMLAS